jgi:hypothetical protein
MAVAVVIDVPNGNQEFHEQFVPTLLPDGELPEGWHLHIAGPAETGWRIGVITDKLFAHGTLRFEAVP